MGKLTTYLRLYGTHTAPEKVKEAFKWVYDHRTTTMSSRVSTVEYYKRKIDEFLHGIPNDRRMVHLYNNWARKYNRRNGYPLDEGLIGDEEEYLYVF